MKTIIESEQEYSLDIYHKRDLVIAKGKDAVVWDETGKKYIDCVTGNGAAAIGHCNKYVQRAVRKQMKKIISCPGTFYNDTRARLMEKLINISPENLKKVFLCNSGTEAIEAAIKFARFSTGRTDFVCAMNGFHGRTMGSLSATFNPKYREEFLPLVPGFSFVPFNDFEKLKNKINKNTAGIILEIIQGEGGINTADSEYFRKVRKLCDAKRILLIIDEVQTGFCRTGKIFAVEHVGIKPDILCLAKAIAGGIPMGAVLCSERIKAPQGKHGSTFGGNPLSCAAAIAAIDFMLQENLAEKAAKKGVYLMKKLRNLQLSRVREIRGKGLMIGIQLNEPVKPYILKLIDEGVLTLPAGKNVLRLLPPLIISYSQLDDIVRKLQKVLM